MVDYKQIEETPIKSEVIQGVEVKDLIVKTIISQETDAEGNETGKEIKTTQVEVNYFELDDTGERGELKQIDVTDQLTSTQLTNIEDFLKTKFAKLVINKIKGS